MQCWYSFLGMCEYKHCVQQDWTMWTLSSTTSSGSCPNEERYKRWTATIDYKGAFANCIGIGPQQCQQDLKEVRKKGKQTLIVVVVVVFVTKNSKYLLLIPIRTKALQR